MSRLLAEGCEGPAVHMHTDDFYWYIKKGYIPPWQEGSGAQNGTVINAAAACAGEYARGGYTVFVDGVIGPWFLGPWLELVMEGMDVRYIVLLPGEEETLARAAGRGPQGDPELKPENVSAMWRRFAELGEYGPHALDTAGQSPEETAAVLGVALAEGLYELL